MFREICGNDDIFSQDRFINDEPAFILMEYSRGSEGAVLVSDGHSIAARSFPGVPVWVWDDGLADTRALARDVRLRFSDAKAIVAKPETSRAINAEFSDKTILTTRMCVYVCREPVGIDCAGHIDRPRADEVMQVAELIAEDINATSRTGESSTAAEQLSIAAKFIASPDFRVWREPDGQIASMALLAQKTARFARINTVCTSPRFRGNGFAAALVSELASITLEQGLAPMLYADADYPSSNKAYIKAGFTAVNEIWENNYAEKVS